MKELLVGLLSLAAVSSYASNEFYVEADLFNPLLKTAGSTSIESYDLRIGYELEKWDISLRYLQSKGISYSGGSAGSAPLSVSDANDQYFSLRAGYKLSSFVLGGGVGSYTREYEATLTSNISDSYTDKATPLEIFANYTTSFEKLYLKYEVNYIAAALNSKQEKESGGNSYDIEYRDPDITLGIFLGYKF